MLSHLHTEEVSLRSGINVPAMNSTTGRRLYPVERRSPTPVTIAGTGVSPCRTPPPPEELCLDRYGFRVTLSEKAAEDATRRAQRYSPHDLEAWNRFSRSGARVPHATKIYCRKGIPQTLRKKVWQQLLGTYGMSNLPHRRQEYTALVQRPLADQEAAAIIERDLGRTFPTHSQFDSPAKRGQVTLRRLLRAYANRNPAVGYCQGMSFIAATLLLQLEEEEDTFWGLCSIMEEPRYSLKQLYAPGFLQLKRKLYVLERLLQRKEPHIYHRLQSTGLEASFFATHWFLTLFSYDLTFSLVSRIWDMFLCEGWKPIFRVSVGLIHMSAKRILEQSDSCNLLIVLRAVHENKNPEKILRRALKIKFKTASLKKFGMEFNPSK